MNINTCTGKNKNLKNRKLKRKRNRNETGEKTYAGALRAPRAGSPAFVSVFVFILIFGFSNFDLPKYNADDNCVDDNYIFQGPGRVIPSNGFNLVKAITL